MNQFCGTEEGKKDCATLHANQEVNQANETTENSFQVCRNCSEKLLQNQSHHITSVMVKRNHKIEQPSKEKKTRKTNGKKNEAKKTNHRKC